jgi:hypothetical protein
LDGACSFGFGILPSGFFFGAMEPPELLGYVVAVVAIIGTALYLRSRRTAGPQDVPLNAKVPPAFYVPHAV